jgi:uncharacterized protein YwqG
MDSNPTHIRKQISKYTQFDFIIGRNNECEVIYQSKIDSNDSFKYSKARFGDNFQDTIRQKVSNLAKLQNPISNDILSVDDYYFENVFGFDELLVILKNFWIEFKPGGFNLMSQEVNEIEEEFISWMSKFPCFLDGIPLKCFLAWLEPICNYLNELKGSSVVFISRKDL